MKRCQRIGLGLTLAVALAVQASATAYTCHAVQYRDVIPESSIQGANYPSGVNDRGDTVGTYQVCNNGSCVEHGVSRLANGTIVSIQYPKSNGTSARSINNSGQIVGTFTDVNGIEHGYIRNADGKFLQIDPPAQFSGDALELWAISDNGNLLGVIHPPTDSQDDSQWHSVVRDTQGNFSVFPWRACCQEGDFRTAAINDSKDYVLWGDFQIYHSDGGSTPLSFPLYTTPWAVYGIDNEGEVTAAAFSFGFGDELPLLRNTSGHFPIIDCQSILPSKINVDSQAPLAISGNGTVAGAIVYDMGNSNPSVQVAFVGLPQSGQPALEGLPKSVKFPLTPVDQESDITINLGNGGNAPLSLRKVVSENREDFFTHACPDEVPPGQTCGVELSYAPSMEEKNTTGPVVLYDNTPDGPHIIQLSGSSRNQSLQFSRNNWTFSGHPVGETSGPGTIWIYNTGPWKVTFSKIYFEFGNNGDFKIIKDLCTGVLFAYHTCSVSFDFTPTAVGGRNSFLEFDNDFNFNNFVKVGGVGEGKSLQFSNTSWMFGTRRVGQATGPATVYIYNNGTEPITFSPASVGGANPADFQIVRDTCSGTLPAYHTCGIKFTFQPTATGMRTAALLLNNNSPSSPQTVRLSGTGN
jgi:hypothetical protein